MEVNLITLLISLYQAVIVHGFGFFVSALLFWSCREVYFSVGYLEGGESSVWFCFHPKASPWHTWYVIAENKRNIYSGI